MTSSMIYVYVANYSVFVYWEKDSCYMLHMVFVAVYTLSCWKSMDRPGSSVRIFEKFYNVKFKFVVKKNDRWDPRIENHDKWLKNHWKNMFPTNFSKRWRVQIIGICITRAPQYVRLSTNVLMQSAHMTGNLKKIFNNYLEK